MLFYDRWAYLIPQFSAAEPIDAAPFTDLQSETADTYFTRRKIVGEQTQTTPYDRAGTDRSRINFQIMMFYRVAGGSNTSAC